MDKAKFLEDMSDVLEIKNDNEILSSFIIGTDLDSLAMLQIISYFEESFEVTLETDNIIGKTLNDLYDLIG